MKILYIGVIEPKLLEISSYRKVVRQIENVEDFKQVYRDCIGLVFKQPLVLYDISLLGFRQSYLLKFIENFKGNLLCLASYDNIPFTVISRFNKVIKDINIPEWEEPVLEEMDDVFLSTDRYIDDEKARKLIFKNFPDLMPFYEQTQKAKARRKLLQLKINLRDHNA